MSRVSALFVVALASTLLLLSGDVTTGAAAQTFAPALVSSDVGNVTITFAGDVLLGDYVFINNDSSCSTAAYLRAATQQDRTALERLRLDNTTRFDVSKLREGTFYMCHSRTGDFPASFVSLGWIKVLHTVYVAPGTLNIDQGNVTVHLQHSVAGRSVFLLLTIAGGVPTGLTCADLATGGLATLANRTAIVTIAGDLSATLDIGHLFPGEYRMCYSDSVFVSEAATPFAALPQTVHLVRTKLCVGGGLSGICYVAPTAIDKRAQWQSFYLYPARPRTHAYLLRTEVCGAATYTCADNRAALEAQGLATPVGRVGFDRTVTLNVSTLVPGSSKFVLCHLNVSSDSPPAFAAYRAVTAASITVSGGPDPSQTIVSCCQAGNTYVAGTLTTCTAFTYDVSGLPTGIPDDACTLQAEVTDPNGNPVCASQLRYRSLGRFEFDFNATVAGANLAAIQHFNHTGGLNTISVGPSAAMVNIAAAGYDEMNSLSACSNAAGIDTCLITKRDSHGNAIETCTSRSNDVMMCNGGAF